MDRTGSGFPSATATASAAGSAEQRFMEFLARVTYRRVRGGEDMEDIFRLRYRSYLWNGLVVPSRNRSVSDDFDATPNAYIFGVYVDGELAATIRLHHSTILHPSSPAMKLFSDLLMPRLERGDTYVDPSKLAVDPDLYSSSLLLPTIAMRLAYMACRHLSSPYYITMIRDDHEVFYKRMFGFRRIAEAREYDGAINCSVPLYEGDIAAYGASTVRRFPFFRFAQSEARMLFDRPSLGESAPLAVVPSARFVTKQIAA